MTEFKIKGKYLGEERKKFFNQKLPELNYYKFSVLNASDLPNQHFHYPNSKNKSIIWIATNNFARESFQQNQNYRFVLILGETGVKFKTNKHNWLVLKSEGYFRKSLRSVGHWESKENFFQQDIGDKKSPKNFDNDSPCQKINSDWTKIFLFLPIIIIIFLFLWFTNWVIKKQKSLK